MTALTRAWVRQPTGESFTFSTDHHRLLRCDTPPTLSAADRGPRGAGICRANGPGSRRGHWRPATWSAGQEIRDQPRELRRLLHLWHVTAVLHNDKPRALDGTLIDLTTIDRRDRVLASPHQQCRRADARQEMLQSQAVHIGLPCDSAGHLAVLLDEIGLLRRPLVPPVAHELRRLLGPMEGAPQSGQSRLQEIVEDLALFGLDAHCADEDHLVEERRCHGRNLGGRPPAERAADHAHRRAKIEIPGEPRNPGGEIVNAHDPIRAGRPTVAGKRWNDYIVALGKILKTLEPARHAEFAVDQEQRWAAAAAPQLDRDPTGLDEPRRVVHCGHGVASFPVTSADRCSRRAGMTSLPRSSMPRIVASCGFLPSRAQKVR